MEGRKENNNIMNDEGKMMMGYGKGKIIMMKISNRWKKENNNERKQA